MRSSVEFSGMINTIFNPSNLEINANAIPVFPLVASTSVSPFLISPRFNASLIILKAGLSFTLPPGLFPSSFKNSLTPFLEIRCVASTKGVFPIWPNMLFSNAILFWSDFNFCLIGD